MSTGAAEGTKATADRRGRVHALRGGRGGGAANNPGSVNIYDPSTTPGGSVSFDVSN